MDVQDLRLQALLCAERSRLEGDDEDQILARAEKFLVFLMAGSGFAPPRPTRVPAGDGNTWAA